MKNFHINSLFWVNRILVHVSLNVLDSVIHGGFIYPYINLSQYKILIALYPLRDM